MIRASKSESEEYHFTCGLIPTFFIIHIRGEKMSKSDRSSYFNTGYRDWFQSFRYKKRLSIPIFILDYETHSLWEETYESYDDFENQDTKRGSNLVNGIQIYFLDENQEKRKAFLRHSPYFYLLLDEGLSKIQINRIIFQIKETGKKQVTDVEANNYYDAANLTFLNKRLFIKIIVDRPRSVPNLRTKCESIKGVVEWREADVLFHHRCAIDHNIHIGAWYQAEISGSEIRSISPIQNKAPPQLRILAYDIETVFELTREPNPNRDEISMISLFTGDENTLLVNSTVVDTKDVRNFDILLKPSDSEHSKPWVDWIYSKDTNDFSSVIEHYFVNVVVLNSEKEVLNRFYKIIREHKPDVLADFFGGRFDIPFIAIRSDKYNISFERETGFRIVFKNQGKSKRIERKDLHNNYTPASLDYAEGAGIIHLDAWLFNEKYSYLPKKDLALKPSVEKKLKIIPIGREALFAINEKPEEAVAYAGCDGYITWKYVKEIVMEFFLSMGQMFPVPASELLSRRAGSLDDLLIDAEDYKHGIIGKRKIKTPDIASFSDRISIDSLAYTGGLVEARRPGIFRSDIYFDYEVDRNALEGLKDAIQDIIKKESDSLLRRVIKDEYEKQLVNKLEDVKVEYSDDPLEFLKTLENELLKNGISRQDLGKKMDDIRNILEELSSIHVENIDKVIAENLNKIDTLIALKGKTQLRGVHVDVTSMYPSQIRQYKLQPSGIVSPVMCRTCEFAESDDGCFFEGDWVIKLSSRRPCRFKEKGSEKCDPSVCTSNTEVKCKKYEPLVHGVHNSQEVYTFNKKESEVYLLKNNGKLEKVLRDQTYLGGSTTHDPYISLQHWLLNSIDATHLSTKLNQNHFDIFEDQPDDFKLPSNSYMSIDVKTKKITVLLSVKSRVCQKSYNFVARIMDDFFNTRIRHKFEAQRLKQVIKRKKSQNEPVSPELLRQQRFHDSTQLGMKVPLNSIYGLLGMKAGVRNASTPCAGITTKLSADLIHWAANELEKIGLVTELDTDGVWLWVPKLFPLSFPVQIVNPTHKSKSNVFNVSIIDKILNEKVDIITRNDNYWNNDGTEIVRTSKSLIKFEQDGPYDFQFVMGKKKYILYNYDNKNKEWQEKELTGLESKRADFSKLQKYFQESLIKAYLEQYNPDEPIELSQLYQNAIKTAEKIRNEMLEGKLDPSFFVKPKAINKPLRAYKSKLPQVSAAYILKDLGFSVEPGTRIQMLNLKGNHVIPSQIFDFSFKKIKEVLIKHAICTLDFMVGDLSSKDDLRKLIDVKQYESDIFGPGRIYDRMIRYPMEIQNITKQAQKELDIGGIKRKIQEQPIETTNKSRTIEKSANVSEEEGQFTKARKLKIKKPQKKEKRKKGAKKIKRVPKSLESLFQINKETITQHSTSTKRKKTKKIQKKAKKLDVAIAENKATNDKNISSTSHFDDKIYMSNEETGDKSLVSSDELRELETQNIFSNGSDNNKNNDEYELNVGTEEEGRVVCSECGALVDLDEITDEGCRFCGGNILVI